MASQDRSTGQILARVFTNEFESDIIRILEQGNFSNLGEVYPLLVAIRVAARQDSSQLQSSRITGASDKLLESYPFLRE